MENLSISDYQLTIGFEFEMLAHRKHYNDSSELTKALPKGWTSEYDGSLKSFNEFGRQHELQSRPFDLDDDKTLVPDAYRVVLAKFNEMAKSNYSCGIHCHIIANGQHAFTRQGLEKMEAKFRPYANKWRGKEYTKPGIGGSMGNGDKYHVIKWISPKHIEIRAFNGSLRWATFLRYFIQIRKAVVEMLGKPEEVETDFEDLFGYN